MENKKAKIFIDGEPVLVTILDKDTVIFSYGGMPQRFELSKMVMMPYYRDIKLWMRGAKNINGKRYRIEFGKSNKGKLPDVSKMMRRMSLLQKMPSYKKKLLTKLLRLYRLSLLSLSILYKDVDREAKKLGLKLQRKSDPYGYSVVIFDTKSKASTRGIMPRTPETLDFNERLSQLKKFIKGRLVLYQDLIVKGFK